MVQRLVLVYTDQEERLWMLLLRGGAASFSSTTHRSVRVTVLLSAPAAPQLHLPAAAALRTHAVTWAANLVVQEALPSCYYDLEVSTLGVFSLQHRGRMHGRGDGVCFNTLVALLPDRVQLDEDGAKVEGAEPAGPPPVENPQYVWHQVQKESLRQKLLETSRNLSILPLHSLY